MGLERDEVGGRVRRRQVERSDDRVVVLRADLSAPLSRQDAEALLVEGHHAAQHPIEGVVAPHAVRADPFGVEMTLEAVHPELARLDHLLEAIRHRGETLDLGLAAALTSTVAHLAHQIHRAAPLSGAPRVHRALRPSSILLSPAGSVALLGAGFPILDALLVPAPEHEADRLRYLAPEAARGEPTDRRRDVYALGTLYYELAARQPYRATSATSDLGQKALEGKAPDLPGTLVDARSSLVRLLAKALAPRSEVRFASALGFAEAVEAELSESGRSFAGPKELSLTLERYLGGHHPRGAHALIAPSRVARPPGPSISAHETPTRPEPPTEDLLVAIRPPAIGSDSGPASLPTSGPKTGPTSEWDDVLGGEPQTNPPERPPSPAAKASPGAPRPKLTLPEAPAGERPKARDPASAPKAEPIAAPFEPPSRPAAPTALDELLAPHAPSWRPPARARGRPRVGFLIGGLLVAVIGLGGYAWLRGDVLSGVDNVETESTHSAIHSERDPNGLRQEPSSPTTPTPKPTRATRPPEETPKPIQLLSVMSQPSGATVELDGGYIGQTPLVLKHQFKKSQYTLTILRKGYRRWEKVVSPDPKLHTINVLAQLEEE